MRYTQFDIVLFFWRLVATALIAVGIWKMQEDQIFFSLLIAVGAAIFVFMGKQELLLEEDKLLKRNRRLFHTNDYRRPILYSELKEVVYIDGEHHWIYVVFKFIQHLTGSVSAHNYFEFHFKNGAKVRWKALNSDEKNREIQSKIAERINTGNA